jgi:2-polyprenyl-3-methyl-5-hydroxy-6-metoxy-1,4-benzoquinol methylase
MRRRPGWNHNVHDHPLILDAIPRGARRALDVGCGAGGLARELRRRIPSVTGIDPDPESIRLARAAGTDIDYVQGDFLSHHFQPGSFDFVTAVASLHHMDAERALARTKRLLRPDGVLAVIGLARSRLPHDLAWELAGAVSDSVHRIDKRLWQHPSPTVWPPPATYAEMRRLAAAMLPGARYRRHALWRYSIIWTKPAR